MGEDGPLGWVPVEGRRSLPFALVHGESLVAAASWALGEAEVTLFDATVPFDEVRRSARPLVLHDPLCPLTPVAFLRDAVERSAETDEVVVGFRPVTDTVKRTDGDRLGATVDRAGLREVTSPVVVPARVLGQLGEPEGAQLLHGGDLSALVAALAPLSQLVWLEAPALGRRVREVDDLPALEALSRASSA
jgi:2-C-methyl-D-erythritol 4-phosphate cytidylyltransferase